MQNYLVYINELFKEYKISKYENGISGGIKRLFRGESELITAVDNLNLEIKEGEIVGLLGPNGSGKSTTIKIMTGLLKPSKGSVLINGKEPYKCRTQVARQIGVVFGQRTQLWWALPVIESFRVIKEMYDLDDATYYDNLKLFENMTDIQLLYDKPIRQLSLGQRTLCEILATFLHDPKVVFLDEPTIGLDVKIKQKIHNIIVYFNKVKNTTILVTSHDISDIEALCNRVVILSQGKKFMIVR